MTEQRSTCAMARVIARKEITDLLRDRRTVFLSFVLPLVLYPILIFIVTILPSKQQAELEKETFVVGVSNAVPYFDEIRLEEILRDHSLTAQKRAYSEAQLRDGTVKAYLQFESVDLSSVDSVDDGSIGSDEGDQGQAPRTAAEEELYKVVIRFFATDSKSLEARHRAESALKECGKLIVEKRFSRHAVLVEADAIVRVEAHDLATVEEKNSSKLGRLLPIFVIILLFTGGSFAAIDLLAGEKERGTLETLCLHPVSRSSIVAGKFSVVMGVSITAVSLNYLGMVLGVNVCEWVGLGLTQDGMPLPVPIFVPRVSTIALIALLLIPFSAFTSAILLSLSAYSRSFREAQNYLFPVMLLSMVAMLLGLAPQVELGSVVAVVPIANVTLGIREALLGTLQPVPYMIVFASSCAYAWLALKKCASLLQREDIVLGFQRTPQPDEVESEQRSRRVLLFGAGMLLAVYFAKTLATWSFVSGLIILLWVIVLLPSLAYPVIFRLPVRETFGWARTPFVNYIVTIAMVPVTAAVALGYLQFQEWFLPMPEAVENPFSGIEDLGMWAILLLLAVSPGICEEILCRGVFQSQVSRPGRAVRTVVLVALYFGLLHLSLYRIIPTALVGVVLAIVRLRTGSIFPCILFHILYNAMLVSVALMGEHRPEWEYALKNIVSSPALWVVCVLVLIFAARRLHPNSPPYVGESLAVDR